jgi:acyl-CoA thioesterase I
MKAGRGWGLIALGAGLAAGLSAASADDARRPPWCVTPAVNSYTVGDATFDRLRAKLARGEAITVVAVGSSSTEGSDLPDRTRAYPGPLKQRLGEGLGVARVHVVKSGRGSEKAADTVRRFDADVIAHEPDLVVWQVGANDIINQLDNDTVRAGVRDGLTRLTSAGAAVVLMNSQAAPRLNSSPALEPIHKVLEEEALAQKALVWSRFDLMTSILNNGQVKLRDLVRSDDVHMTVEMHACTGFVLADMIMQKIAPQMLSALQR